jgi:hypothetical protein
LIFLYSTVPIPIPIKIPIPVKIPMPQSQTPKPFMNSYRQSFQHQPQNNFMPNSFFTPGMSTNAYNSSNVKTSTFKTQAAQNQFYGQGNSHYPYHSSNSTKNQYSSNIPQSSQNHLDSSKNVFNTPMSMRGSHQFNTPMPSTYNPSSSNKTIFGSQAQRNMQAQLQKNLQKNLQEQLARQSSGNLLGNNFQNMNKYYPSFGQNQTVPAPVAPSQNSLLPPPLPISQPQPVTQTTYEPAYSNRENKSIDVTAQNSDQKVPEVTTKEIVEKQEIKIKEPTYEELIRKLSDSNRLNEDIRSKIDYLYQSNMPKNGKLPGKKSLTLSPIVNTLDDYEHLYCCSEERDKSEEILIDNSSRNITMINNTIKDINHKIKKLKKSSRTRS